MVYRRSTPELYREVALGPGSTEVRAGDFRVLSTTLPARFRIPKHTHLHHNLAYTVTGGLIESFDRERLCCRPGDVVLKPAGIPHEDAFDEMETTTLQVEWNPEAAGVRGVSLDRVLRFRADTVTLLAAQLYAELHIRDTATPLVVEGLALQLLGSIVRGGAPRREAVVPPWLSRIRGRLHDEPGAGLGIRDLATDAGVSTDYLARRFRQAYGMTVGKYWRRIRLERAAAELLRPDERISEVALRAGFSDQAHFTREFKRAFGLPPGAYRERAMRRTSSSAASTSSAVL